MPTNVKIIMKINYNVKRKACCFPTDCVIKENAMFKYCIQQLLTVIVSFLSIFPFMDKYLW